MLHTLLPDMNIAPLKYAHVHKEHGGPIASISFRERELPGGKIFEAFATLDEKTTGFKKEGQFLYGNAHGTGTAATKPEAIYCAISEALERWAWSSAYQDPTLRKALRYDLDPSTTGFAAFPGLGLHGARKRAFFEATERWSLCMWWEGKLPHSDLKLEGVSGISLQSGVPGTATVVIWSEEHGLTHYGFASSINITAAVAKAKIELQRNKDVLEFYAAEKKKGALPPLGLTERRLRFFAEPAGYALFKERLSRKGSPSTAPVLAVDMSVRGPWTQYTHVWRCLFESSKFRENDKDDYFLF